MFVMWTPSQLEHLNLNVDGASRGNLGHAWRGEEDILRGYLGRLIFAFSHFYNFKTNTVAEAMAIKDGLFLYETRNL